MNVNILIVCETCSANIHCRVGMSNRQYQPFSFLCPKCETAIEMDFIDDVPKSLLNASWGVLERSKIISGEYCFIDLHLDFPVWSTGYIPGFTPYMIAAKNIDADKEVVDGVPAVEIVRMRLDVLNHYGGRFNEVKQLLRLYPRANKELFRRKASEFLDEDFGSSLLPQDINLLLYSVLSRVTSPFLEEEAVLEVTKGFPQLLLHLSESSDNNFSIFFDYIRDTGYLDAIQRNCLSLYSKIFEIELYLRPAIYLDFSSGNDDKKSSAKISRLGFDKCKDIYKDLAEVFGRQLILVAAINNLLKRNDFNLFKSKDGGVLSSLDKFADKVLADKFKYLDECWYKVDANILNAGVRNSIAHYSFKYDEVSQVVTCYPEKEGLKQESAIEINFLSFVRMILQLFREVHYLHHLVKALFYYEYLVLNKSHSSD